MSRIRWLMPALSLARLVVFGTGGFRALRGSSVMSCLLVESGASGTYPSWIILARRGKAIGSSGLWT
jgi:hypothetical protein